MVFANSPLDNYSANPVPPRGPASQISPAQTGDIAPGSLADVSLEQAVRDNLHHLIPPEVYRTFAPEDIQITTSLDGRQVIVHAENDRYRFSLEMTETRRGGARRDLVINGLTCQARGAYERLGGMNQLLLNLPPLVSGLGFTGVTMELMAGSYSQRLAPTLEAMGAEVRQVGDHLLVSIDLGRSASRARAAEAFAIAEPDPAPAIAPPFQIADVEQAPADDGLAAVLEQGRFSLLPRQVAAYFQGPEAEADGVTTSFEVRQGPDGAEYYVFKSSNDMVEPTAESVHGRYSFAVVLKPITDASGRVVSLEVSGVRFRDHARVNAALAQGLAELNPQLGGTEFAGADTFLANLHNLVDQAGVPRIEFATSGQLNAPEQIGYASTLPPPAPQTPTLDAEHPSLTMPITTGQTQLFSFKYHYQNGDVADIDAEIRAIDGPSGEQLIYVRSLGAKIPMFLYEGEPQYSLGLIFQREGEVVTVREVATLPATVGEIRQANGAVSSLSPGAYVPLPYSRQIDTAYVADLVFGETHYELVTLGEQHTITYTGPDGREITVNEGRIGPFLITAEGVIFSPYYLQDGQALSYPADQVSAVSPRSEENISVLPLFEPSTSASNESAWVVIEPGRNVGGAAGSPMIATTIGQPDITLSELIPSTTTSILPGQTLSLAAGEATYILQGVVDFQGNRLIYMLVDGEDRPTWLYEGELQFVNDLVVQRNGDSLIIRTSTSLPARVAEVTSTNGFSLVMPDNYLPIPTDRLPNIPWEMTVDYGAAQYRITVLGDNVSIALNGQAGGAVTEGRLGPFVIDDTGVYFQPYRSIDGETALFPADFQGGDEEVELAQVVNYAGAPPAEPLAVALPDGYAEGMRMLDDRFGREVTGIIESKVAGQASVNFDRLRQALVRFRQTGQITASLAALNLSAGELDRLETGLQAAHTEYVSGRTYHFNQLLARLEDPQATFTPDEIAQEQLFLETIGAQSDLAALIGRERINSAQQGLAARAGEPAQGAAATATANSVGQSIASVLTAEYGLTADQANQVMALMTTPGITEQAFSAQLREISPEIAGNIGTLKARLTQVVTERLAAAAQTDPALARQLQEQFQVTGGRIGSEIMQELCQEYVQGGITGALGTTAPIASFLLEPLVEPEMLAAMARGRFGALREFLSTGMVGTGAGIVGSNIYSLLLSLAGVEDGSLARGLVPQVTAGVLSTMAYTQLASGATTLGRLLSNPLTQRVLVALALNGTITDGVTRLWGGRGEMDFYSAAFSQAHPTAFGALSLLSTEYATMLIDIFSDADDEAAAALIDQTVDAEARGRQVLDVLSAVALAYIARNPIFLNAELYGATPLTVTTANARHDDPDYYRQLVAANLGPIDRPAFDPALLGETADPLSPNDTVRDLDEVAYTMLVGLHQSLDLEAQRPLYQALGLMDEAGRPVAANEHVARGQELFARRGQSSEQTGLVQALGREIDSGPVAEVISYVQGTDRQVESAVQNDILDYGNVNLPPELLGDSRGRIDDAELMRYILAQNGEAIAQISQLQQGAYAALQLISRALAGEEVTIDYSDPVVQAALQQLVSLATAPAAN